MCAGLHKSFHSFTGQLYNTRRVEYVLVIKGTISSRRHFQEKLSPVHSDETQTEADS